MEQTQQPTIQLKQWAKKIQEHGLTPIAIPLLDVLQIWGFVGAQLWWMLTPFVGRRVSAQFAEALEQPETLQQLKQYLVEGETQQ